MKRLAFILITSALVCFSACSDDDNETKPTGTISFTLDGITKNFTNINMFSIKLSPMESEEYVQLYWYLDKNSPESLSFSLIKNAVYTSSFWTIYRQNSEDQAYSSTRVIFTVTEYTAHSIKGTFSGILDSKYNGATGITEDIESTITDGVFNIQK